VARLLWIRFLLETSMRNLLRSPRRTAISLLAIAAAVTAMIVFQSFVNGVKSTFRKNVITSVFAHFQISPKGFREEQGDSPFDFKIKDVEELRQDINAIGPLKMFSRRQPFYGLLSYDDRSVGGVGFGIDAEEESHFLTLTQVHEGKHLAGSPEDSVFIGWKLAKRLRIKPGDPITLLVTTASGSMNALDLTVVGTFKTGITELDQGTYQLHHDTAMRILRTEGSPILILGFEEDDELQYKKSFEELIARKYPDLELSHWRVLADFFDNTMGWIEKQVTVFRWIILLIATISIINVFLMGLFERTGEFGTLRAIGTHQGSLGLMIFIESVFQAAIGGVIGTLIAMFAISVALRNGITMPPPPLMSVPFHVSFAIPWENLPGTFLLCVGVCGGAGIYPAIKIARMGIVEALGRNV
jgi:putative ABC transport system permease protein